MRAIVNIDVPELAAAIDFYGAALGLTLARIIDDDVAELSGADMNLFLLAKPPDSLASNTPGRRRNYQRHWTPVHLDFVVDDVASAARRAVEAGARQESRPVEWRGSRCVTLSDPFGHGFCLIEFSGDGYH